MNKIILLFLLNFILTKDKKIKRIYKLKKTLSRQTDKKPKIEKRIRELKQYMIESNPSMEIKLDDTYSQPIDALKEKPYSSVFTMKRNESKHKKSSTLLRHIENELDVLIEKIDEQLKSLSNECFLYANLHKENSYCEISEIISVERNSENKHEYSEISNISLRNTLKSKIKNIDPNETRLKINKNQNDEKIDIEVVLDGSTKCFPPININFKFFFKKINIIGKIRSKMLDAKIDKMFNFDTLERGGNFISLTELANDEFYYTK